MTELIVDAIEYVKNPYKGKKLKVACMFFFSLGFDVSHQQNVKKFPHNLIHGFSTVYRPQMISCYSLFIRSSPQTHPDFPKKPLTPYFRFFMEKRAKYAKIHPEMSNLDLTKILSKKYKELPEKKKVGTTAWS